MNRRTLLPALTAAVLLAPLGSLAFANPAKDHTGGAHPNPSNPRVGHGKDHDGGAHPNPSTPNDGHGKDHDGGSHPNKE